MAVIIIAMVAASVVEKSSGTAQAFRLVYHSPLFIALWAVAAITGLLWFFKAGAKGRGLFTMLLHCAFAVILAGALTTHLFSKDGRVALAVDEPITEILTEDGGHFFLPFSLTLKSFEVSRYTGSLAAEDYRSVIETGDGESMEISMNKIGRHRGWRFYQADYGGDMRTSIIAVSRDPWGIGITYTGYALLLMALIGFFTEKSSRWRAALRRIAVMTALTLTLPCLSEARADNNVDKAGNALPSTPTGTTRQPAGEIGKPAQEAGRLPKAVIASGTGGAELPVAPLDVAEEFGRLYVYYDDRICPLQTQARDYCLKAYGKASIHGCTAEQVMTGWLFWYDWWTAEPLKVKKKERGTAKEDERRRIRMDAASGAAFRIFPLEIAPELLDGNPELQPITWFGCEDQLPDLDYGQWAFIRKSLSLLRDEAHEGNWDEVKRVIVKIREYQEKTAATVLPPEGKVRAERLYNSLCLPRIPFMAAITIGFILFIFSGIWLSRGRSAPSWPKHLLAALSLVLLAYITAVLGLRWYASGHAPFAGSYCVMMLMAWLAALTMSLCYRKVPLLQPLGFLIAGFTMLMASLSGSNPRITHLMPVLQSPLLSIHVLSMMLSYTLLALVMLNGVMGLAVRGDAAKEKLRDLSLVILYPALFLLVAGTFLGAVWANVSWGAYWSWDPKETWALITILIYSAALHSDSLKAFRRPAFFHVYCIVAFLSVLVTYFGVNLLLGGMHSYA